MTSEAYLSGHFPESAPAKKNCSNGALAYMTPPAKRKKNQTPRRLSTGSFKTVVISDRLENNVQVRHTLKGKQYERLSGDTRHHYTMGHLPSILTIGYSRRSRFQQQVCVDVELSIENVIRMLIKSSLAVQHCLKADNVEYFKTNFFQCRVDRDAGPDGEQESVPGTSIYVSAMKDISIDYLKKHRDEPIYMRVFPSAFSWDEKKRLVGVKMGVVYSECSGSNIVARKYNPEVDTAIDIPDGEVDRLENLFLKKWCGKEDLSCNDDDILLMRKIDSNITPKIYEKN